MKRHGMSRKGSRKHFTRNAMHTHRKNISSGVRTVMRGGIRL